MKKFFTSLAIFITFLIGLNLITKNVIASLKINEIYPAPASGEDEWVELYNDEDKTIDTAQFYLVDDKGNKIKISDSTVQSYNFTLATSIDILNNTGDTVYLKNISDQPLDSVTYSKNLSSSQSYAKCPDGSDSWFTLTTITKNSSNNIACLNLTPSISPEDTPSSTSTPETSSTETPSSTSNSQPQTYNNMYLSEVMVQPESGNNEWIEVYNANEFEVALDNWYIDDLENAGTTPKQLPLTIPAKSYVSYDLSSSMFNNDGDSVRLLDFEQKEIDSFQYQSSEKGKTLGRMSFDNDNFCLQTPTKEKANGPCINPTATSTPKLTSSSTSTINQTPTITKTPTKVRSTITPLKFSLFTQNQQSISDSPEEIKGEVLATVSANKLTKNNKIQPLLFSLSFTSLAYSLLAATSILLKLKMNYKK